MEKRESLFCCPHCGQPLEIGEKSYRCPAGHSYDKAASGYVNLLLPGRGGQHGDNREMIAARRRFLEAGHYQPLREAVCSALKDFSPLRLLDVGCGEGWYTEGMLETLPGCAAAGIDVSKEALTYAGKRLRQKAELAAASAYRLPVRDGVFDALTLIFSPFAREECLRALKKGGVFLFVVPGRRHLWELKELLYERPYENEVRDVRLDGFEYIGETRAEYTRRIEGGDLQDLFAMTPYFYRTPEEGKKRALSCPSLDLSLSFFVFLYKKI